MTHHYLRDGRSPVPQRETISKVMSANKARDTKPELALRRALSNAGIKGYRLSWKRASGRPDIAFPAKKIAVFVNGCFWHRCPFCRPGLPKSHRDFWKRKFRSNVRRDKIKTLQLRQAGWKVLTAWECRLKKNAQRSANQIEKLLTAKMSRSK